MSDEPNNPQNENPQNHDYIEGDSGVDKPSQAEGEDPAMTPDAD
jgi:hypothetical protein